MRAIVVDDELIMLNSFSRLSSGIEDLQIVGQFQKPEEAFEYVLKHPVELAFLDVEMPGMNGIKLAEKLRANWPEILIVFISAYEEYIRDSNQIGGDYYIVKPYKRETLEIAMERIRLLAKRQKKDIYVRTFGRFIITNQGRPITLRGKAKEILALIVTRRGKEISNEEIYRTCWEDRAYSNDKMTVYYNALHRLKQALEKEKLENLLISTTHGQMINTALIDCDYYDWLDHNAATGDPVFEGDFLAEYSWSEYLTGDFYKRFFE